MRENNLCKKAACLLVVFLCAGMGGAISSVSGYQPADTAVTGFAQDSRSSRIAKIVSVLENRTPDRKILGKAMEKLLTIDEGQLRLISSLSERIANHSDTPGADIAFSLLTAMIVLS